MHRLRQQVERRSFWITFLALASVVGCGETDRIRRYQVQHEAPPSTAVGDSEVPQRMPAATGPENLRYEVPDGWIPGRTSAFRLAAFDVQRDGKSAEVTLIVLGASAGSLLENVNRWRQQIGLGPIGQEQLDATVRTLDVDGIQSSYVQIVTPNGAEDASTILAVVIPRTDQTLFVKLTGDRNLADDEQLHFESFVKSIRFAASP